MKVGDLIECKETAQRGVIVRSRTTIGGDEPIVQISYGVDWFTTNLEKPAWMYPHQMKVVKPHG